MENKTTMKKNNEAILVYVGTYTHGKSEGIYLYRFDPASGALTLVDIARGVVNPSFLALHPQKPYLYAVNETMEFNEQPGGAVSAFAVNPQTGALAFLNQQLSHGGAPCHLSVERTGQFVLAANYMGGNVAVFPIQADGRLGAAADVVQHLGSGPDPRRQERPHAHSINLDPANRYALAADLGLDKIMVYQLDLTHGRLVSNQEPWATLHAGAGPRHLAFHPNGHYVYVINELDSTMSAFIYDAEKGTMREVQSISALPEGFTDKSYCADVHVAPSGRFVYGSNRGHDSIAIFAVDEATGKLACIGHEPTQGRNPRNFVLDPTGAFLLAANQDSDTVVTFRVNPETGRLTPTGHVVEVPMPVCLKMVRGDAF